MSEFESTATERIRRTATITGQVAMGTAKFTFLILGCFFFGLFALIAWFIVGKLPTATRERPVISWPVESLANVASVPLSFADERGGREDIWQFGGPGTTKPFASLIFWQRLDRVRAVPVQLNTLKGMLPLRQLNPHPQQNGASYEMFTRWGKFSGQDYNYRETNGRMRDCIVFLSVFETPEFSIGGFYCNADGAPAAAGPLACMLDRIQLDSEAKVTPATTFLRQKASEPAKCSHRSHYPPTNRQIIRNRNGGVVGFR
jgi:hypothetical protein